MKRSTSLWIALLLWLCFLVLALVLLSRPAAGWREVDGQKQYVGIFGRALTGW